MKKYVPFTLYLISFVISVTLLAIATAIYVDKNAVDWPCIGVGLACVIMCVALEKKATDL